ncbi:MULTISPECIES: hypothetical protein [Thalassobaculum]|uniref:Uncharacterized protein n=1 Tax=Thalassobaculum litoreum DSM 18839 TaxID=1123362 RepID=A0A8G2BL00_9PROT|nr:MULTISPECIES: hypothetical protein [Thalassobaculum]SDG31755.1 hypothetical protein SAMN05660686_04015 [Thalassobaculum litoreum DSM 18839]
MRKIGRRVGLLGIAALALAGCITAQNTIQPTDSEGRRAFLRYAGGESPVYLRAANPPGALGNHDAVASVMAEAASGAVFGMPTTFTSDVGAATHPNFRIIALFDPVESLSTAEVCESEARSSDVPAARYTDRTNLFLAFCTRGEAIGGTKVSGPKIESLDDPTLRDMTRSGIREMFAIDDRNRGRGDPPILGSFSGNPNDFGFRLNPLEGVVK